MLVLNFPKQYMINVRGYKEILTKEITITLFLAVIN